MIQKPSNTAQQISEKPQICFVSEGKIKTYQSPYQFNGFKWLMDEQNLIDIQGQFVKGICKNAKIFILKGIIITNITVQITISRAVIMGGRQTQQIGEGLIYKGGYLGMKRHGFGTIFTQQGGKDYEQWGIWSNGKPIGQFVKQNYNPYFPEYSLINYQNHSSWKQIKLYKNQQAYFCIETDQKQQDIKKIQICKQIYEQKIAHIDNLRKQYQNRQNQSDIVKGQIQRSQIFKLFNITQLQPEQMLTYDHCQLYLGYLFHQQRSQSHKKTIIINFYMINYYNQLTNQSNLNKYFKQIQKQISKYSPKFPILGGYWDIIVIPLVLTSENHYSFAVYDIKENCCVFYDSINPAFSKQKYSGLIKKLIIEMKGQTIDEKKQSFEIQFILDKKFPKQQDSFSCGYFMLYGIEQIINKGKILFSVSQLNFIKQRIMKKLNILKNKKQIPLIQIN